MREAVRLTRGALEAIEKGRPPRGPFQAARRRAEFREEQAKKWEERVADARIDIECSRLLTLKTAHLMDTVGNKVARAEIAMIKVKAPVMALKIIDDAIQAHGGGGVTSDFGLASTYAGMRTLRLADGPDEVHRRTIAKIEFKRQRELMES